MKNRKEFLISISLFVTIFLFATSCNPTKQGAIVAKGSCSKSDNFWIVKEGAHSQYLVNKSKTKIISFTLKETEIYMNNGSVRTETDTEIHKLNPGEEVELFCQKYYAINDDQKWTEYKYEIVGAVIENE
jgi:hypothetical protein